MHVVVIVAQVNGDKKPEKVEAPRQGYYIVNYKVLKGATLIAFIIMLVWLAALWAF